MKNERQLEPATEPWDGESGKRSTGIGRIEEVDPNHNVNNWLLALGLVQMRPGETIDGWHRRTNGGKEGHEEALNGKRS